ncbi:carboxymuconolactone decarboxylase family protein [Candidatus Deianiraea vastatrix]|uniref:Alkyl hydroperoxide reductase AhpD n=1 Tax=Candidatus Deianiraea vastatrix TaxID=2163644 RepID=A0A5B8XEV6_9RICK|nr:carboxymuconolactone decarboxylase family protein [Candidatus Deianiraea vastatrix]QED23780.1 Alkyl hydroperoxide reductase AhpD [Candidatus Deianiraea vastatrix]
MLENFIDNIPDFAKDIKLNAKSLLLSESSILSDVQVAICAISCAIAVKNKNLESLILEHFSPKLSEMQINAAKSAAAVMSMNNVYYRFLHLCQNQEYSKIPAGLRMNAIASHGIEKVDFELASLAVSSINGCGMCIDSHEKTLKTHNVTSEQIQHSVKIAAVINALSVL